MVERDRRRSRSCRSTSSSPRPCGQSRAAAASASCGVRPGRVAEVDVRRRRTPGSRCIAIPPVDLASPTPPRGTSARANVTGTDGAEASAAIPSAARWIALSACHGRAECPERPENVHVALMFPRQPACSSPSVGSITTTNSASSGERSSSGVSALSVDGQLLAREEQRRVRRPREHELDHHRERALHVRRAEPVHAPVRRSARGCCPAPAPCPGGRRAAPAAASRAGRRARTSRRDPRPRRRPRAARRPRARPAPPRSATRTGCRSARASARQDARPARSRWARGSTGMQADSRMGRSWNALATAAQPSPATPRRQRPAGRSSAPSASPRRRRTPDLEELKELLRTAGVATVGELTQKRDNAAPEPVPRPRQGGRAQAAAQGGGRERRRRRRRAHAAPAAQPGGRARHPGARPHRGDPRHLRLPRAHGRGQDAGRARPARIQHGPHARPVDAPRASRRRPRRRRHRHPRPGRVPDRDGPPARARPHHGPAPPPGGRQGHARDPAGRARARAPAQRRARGLHQRRQVDAAERADGLRGRRPRPPVPHAGPDDAHAAAARPHVPDHRHRRLHPQAPASARGRVRGHAGGDAARRHGPARRRRVRRRGGARRDDARRRGRAGGDRRRQLAAHARPQQGRHPRRRTPPRAQLPPPRRGARLRRRPARASRSCRSASTSSSRRRSRTSSCSCPTTEGALLHEIHEIAGEHRARGHGPRACAWPRGSRRSSRSATAATRSTASRATRGERVEAGGAHPPVAAVPH